MGPVALSDGLWINIFTIRHETKLVSQTRWEMDRGVVCLLQNVLGAAATCHFHFEIIFHSFCLRSLSFFFVLLQFVFISFHFPSPLPPMCARIVSFSFHLHGAFAHLVLMSLYFPSKGMDTAVWSGHGRAISMPLDGATAGNRAPQSNLFDLIRPSSACA